MIDFILQLVVRIFIGFVLNTVCYYVGWVVCRILTLGNYPKEYPHEEGLVEGFVFAKIEVIVGFLSIFTVVMTVALNV